MQAEDAALRRIDNWGAHHRSIDTTVGDRERSPLQFLQLEFVFAGPFREISDAQFDLGKRQRFGVAQNRNDKPLPPADSDADVAVIVVDDVGITQLGIDLRHRTQRLHGCPHEERHEAELHAVPLQEGILKLVAQRHHSAHVDLVERRQQRCLVLGIYEPLSDPPPDRGHQHRAFLASARHCQRPCGENGCDGGPRRRSGRGGGGGESVRLGDPAAGARSRESRRSDARFPEDACRGRHHTGWLQLGHLHRADINPAFGTLHVDNRLP